MERGRELARVGVSSGVLLDTRLDLNNFSAQGGLVKRKIRPTGMSFVAQPSHGGVRLVLWGFGVFACIWWI